MNVPDHLLPHLAQMGYSFHGPITVDATLDMIKHARQQGNITAAELLTHVLVRVDKGQLCGDTPHKILQQLS